MPLQQESQPIYKIDVDAAACRYEIRLNDVPIHKDERGLPLDVEFPVNEWMIDGVNVLSARIRPTPVFDDATGEELIDEEAYDEHESWLKLTFYVKRNGAPREERQKIASLNFVAQLAVDPALGIETSSEAGRFDSANGFAEDEEGDVLVSPVSHSFGEQQKEVLVSREIALPVFFPRWRWLDGEEVAYDEDTMIDLAAEYMEVWEWLDAGAVAEVEELIRLKTEEYTDAYYLTTEDEIRDMVPLPDLMQSEDLELLPLPEEVDFEVFGDNRLARLVDEDGDSPIVFSRGDDVGYFMYLTYHRTPDGWELTR